MFNFLSISNKSVIREGAFVDLPKAAVESDVL